MASHIAAGFAQNISLTDVKLRMNVDCLAIACTGIGRSIIKSLSVDKIIGPVAKFLSVISTLLPIAPSLKTLVVNADDDYDEDHRDENPIDELFSRLQHPGCSIDNLQLQSVRLGSSDVTLASRINRNLPVLVLIHVHFCNRNSVSQLWHLVGLKELRVTEPFFDDGDNPGADCWAELVQRNPNLLKLYASDTVWNDCAEGLLNGACGHESLETIDIEMSDGSADLDLVVGGQLCRLFRETKSLKTARMSGFIIHREGAELMVKGICENKTLQEIPLEDGEITFPVYTLLVESFLVNQHFVFKKVSLQAVTMTCDLFVRHYLRSLQ